MDGRGSAGSPSAALSHSCPAHTDEDQQSRESVSLSEFQKHLSPGEKYQSLSEQHQISKKQVSPEKQLSPLKKKLNPTKTQPSPPEKQPSPPEKQLSPPEKKSNPTEKQPSPTEKNSNPTEKQPSPPEKQPSRAEKQPSPPEQQPSPAEQQPSPAEKQLSRAEKQPSPAEKQPSPPEQQPSPAEKKSNPPEKQPSPAEKKSNPPEKQPSPPEKQSSPPDKQLSPPEKKTNPTEKQQSPAEKKSNLPEKQPSPPEKQPSPPEKQPSPPEKQPSPLETEQLALTKYTNHCDPQTEKQKREISPGPKPDKSSATKEDRLKPDSLPTDPQKLGNSPEQKTKDSHGSHQLKPDLTSSIPRKSSPAKTDQRKLDHLSTEQQKAGEPSPKDLPKLEQPSPTKPDPLDPELLCTHQNKPKCKQKPDNSHEDHTKCLCLTNQKTEDLTLIRSKFNKQNQKDTEFDISESKNLQNDVDPLSEKLTLTTPEMDQCIQDPLPPHLNIQETPSLDQKNHQSSPQHLSSVVHPTTAMTLDQPAAPLTIEAFCEQVWPCPPASSSGEPKLCGFLQKQGGPLRAWKQRWFTYEEKKNQLFYYRTPQDVMPLGRVELSGATFTYPLKAEKGTFHIKTPERTFILKAVTQELMLYWLQQLQMKRWQHRHTSTCPNLANNNAADTFLPLLKSPLGLVGEEAANIPSPRAPLANVSIKHPLIELQNSVHCLRKRSSHEWSQSVFHVEAPRWIPPNPADTSTTTNSSTPVESPIPPTPWEGRESPTLFDGRRRKTKTRTSLSTPVLREETLSSDRTSRLQQEKQILMEEVKAQKELVWILHKALEAAQLEKRTCAEFLAEKGEQERLELLRHRERQAADLRRRLEVAETEVEAMRRIVAQKDAQLDELQDNIRMLKEKNNAKQQVIIKLSDQVTACLSDPRRSGSSSGECLDSQTFRQLQQEMENLKDDIEAYKTQNRFLNSEIHQLTSLWRNSSEQERSLMAKCAYLEASNCQVESRYLGVLRKLQEAKSLDPVQREAVQNIIEDALKGELKSTIKLNTASAHDEYGFKIIPDYEAEDMKLLAKIQALEIRSHNLLHEERVERPLLGRWAQYLAGRAEDNLCASPELKALLRVGVPQEYRQRVWRWVVRARTRTTRECHPQRYQQLCEKSRTSPHPASRQIQLDLHRTLTTNQHFSSPSSPALQQLHRVLLAFSWQNPAIGYCQGLNRLAAIALLVLQSEEDAFWCLVAVVEGIMPQDYYTKNLVASQADQRVLKDFLAEKLPRLAAHFEDHSIDVSLVTFNWFLVVFVESLPSDILLPLWDAFLYEGTKVIFRYALALFKYKEDDFLKIHDSVEIYQYLRFFTKTISDSRRLTNIAFSDMNPFPRRLLRNRRVLHLERLQGELRELEEQQREFVTESTQHKDRDLDTMVSEDDDEL
ncbi:TBC1 domain family member 2A [Mastacembelus armatus]|uniref:TBC1 domain family, member 2 n=1 Tax=Mastacembelus armatus TaxID=205130 RepID=A0A3Q3M348_9TELE|nr:TBC1 domain family member 2A-like [Mastacembelus armatus]XP_026186725.1 TBC1 domain family member 2A-like [Mastacembelus armatus]